MCDSDKEVEDIKTEENVETDEASTETEDCEKKDLPEEPQYEILDVEELQISGKRLSISSRLRVILL